MDLLRWLATEFADLDGLAELRRGGFKRVFSAQSKKDGDVVLKLIDQDPESIAREIEAVKQVDSHRVPKILDHGDIDTPLGARHWVVEQRVNGSDLREVLKKSPLDVPQLLRLGVHTLEALVKAEEVQIVHRDVKPENLIVDGSGDFWLVDFGIARHRNMESLTPTAALGGKGTLGYAPPEQMHNLKPQIDGRADLFALGVTLHECATGVQPFWDAAGGDETKCARLVQSLALRPLRLSMQRSSNFDDFVATLTQKRASQRPETALEALEWLGEICSTQS